MLGSTGDDVRAWQQLLVGRGWDTGGVDGGFGRGTNKATRGFQADKGLEVDGVVGPSTWDTARPSR